MAQHYRLTYFNSQALGEAIRLMLAYGGIEFEDIRIDFQKEWPSYPKEQLPFGQLPMLEIDGKKLFQTIAIGRYLAKKVGLYGSNPMEDYEIDLAVDNLNDFRASEYKNTLSQPLKARAVSRDGERTEHSLKKIHHRQR